MKATGRSVARHFVVRVSVVNCCWLKLAGKSIDAVVVLYEYLGPVPGTEVPPLLLRRYQYSRVQSYEYVYQVQ